MTKQTCPNCGSHDVELREYYDDGVLTDQLFECKTCGETGDKYDFANKDEPKNLDQEMAEAAMMMCGVDPKPARKKSEFKMLNPQFFPCVSLRPDHPELAGKFIAMGHVPYTNDDGSLDIPEEKTRTSMIVNVNIEKGYFETLNSIYWIV